VLYKSTFYLVTYLVNYSVVWLTQINDGYFVQRLETCLCVAEFVPLRDHVELDPILSSREERSTDQQDREDHVRKRSREIDNLNISASE